MRLVDKALSVLFPVRTYIIKDAEEATAWFRYAASNHPEIDPYRPLGYRDSWAGRVKEHPPAILSVREKRCLIHQRSN